MKSYYRTPQVEPGIRNVILQNRCGNRLTAMVFEDRTEMELVYKPNAGRRKDLYARNFSNRDIYTLAIPEILLPEITAQRVQQFHYDPFMTQMEIGDSSGAKNCITLVNVADHNCFALSAPAPLLVSFRPHDRFQISDGLLWEAFEDRGENIVSFVMFPGYQESRFRVLEDGQTVIQLLEDDVVLIGAEESIGYVDRIAESLAGLDLGELCMRNEDIIAPVLGKSRIVLDDDPGLQEVLDVNTRFVWSGIDEGGACFGAMNRIYHLIWVRDGSMSAATLARAGWPDPIRLWAPLLLENPNTRKDDHGQRVREFLQLVGTRWCKAEDDGIYYAMLTLHDYWRSTGQADLVERKLEELLEILDHTIEDRFDENPGLFGSDTLGEDPTEASPYFGYDVVNGSMHTRRHDASGDKPIKRVYSLYQNVNMFNCLRMAQTLIAACNPEAPAQQSRRYQELCERLTRKIREVFVNEQGRYRALLFHYQDGSEEWRDFSSGCDCWEYAWAVSAGPFYLDPALSLESAREAVRTWPSIRSYGYCPWNFLARLLKEHGLSSQAYRSLLDQQIREARTQTQKYPMAPLVTEYQNAVESWRGLPFGIGSLVLSVGSLLIQQLAQGIAVRAGSLVDRIDRFCYKTARINARAQGQGDSVQRVRLNGKDLAGTLQLPEAWLRAGCNELDVQRGSAPGSPRLYSSDAICLDVREVPEGICIELQSPFEIQAVLEGVDEETKLAVQQDGKPVEASLSELADTGRKVMQIGGTGLRSLILPRA